MTYLTPQKSGENTGRRRYGLFCAYSASVLVIVGIFAYVTGSRLAGVYFLEGGGVFLVVASELRYPGFVPCFVLMVGPIIAVLNGAHENRDIWRTWQYWVAAIICISAGALGFVWLNRRYGKKTMPILPNQSTDPAP